MAYAVQVVLRAGLGAAGQSAHLLDARGEPGNLSRRSVAVKNAFLRTALQLGLGRLERSLRSRFVPASYGNFDLLDIGAHAADSRAVADRAASVAPDAFLRGLMMRHVP